MQNKPSNQRWLAAKGMFEERLNAAIAGLQSHLARSLSEEAFLRGVRDLLNCLVPFHTDRNYRRLTCDGYLWRSTHDGEEARPSC